MTTAALCLGAANVASSQQPAGPLVPQAVRDRAARDGSVPVLVELRLPAAFRPEANLPDDAAVRVQRQQIATRAERVLSSLPRASFAVRHEYRTIPYLALSLTPAAVDALDRSAPDVARVVADDVVRVVLADSVPIVQGDQAWASGYDGTGTTIAIIDTGVDAAHPFLHGKVVEEACYSSTVPNLSQTVCPNGLDEQLGPGAAVPCSLADCIHGTHVAGIAAGNGDQAGQTFSGVAKGAQLMAVQVFSRITDLASCGGFAPCAGAFTSDIIAGLERVYDVAASRSIAAVNMSLGGGTYDAPCDDQPYKPIIDNLRAAGVPTVIASGNNGSRTQMSAPACVSSAISVASTDKTDEVSYFSNVSPELSLFAPGDGIVSSVPGGGYQSLSGTSMAAPHVAGAWAILHQATPASGIDGVLQALQSTGKLVTDTRLFGGVTTKPRIRIFQALATLAPIANPSPEISMLSPARARAGSTVSLSVTGTGFNAFSVGRWNGAARSTDVKSTTRLVVTIPSRDLSSAGTGQVSVFNPTPGGGTSSSLPFTIDPPPTLTVNTTAVAPGSPATVTLADGYGGNSDWLALAPTGASDTSYIQWTYVGAGITSRTWTVTMPSTAGTYEFRLFANNTRAATSPAVTVDPSLNPVPEIASLAPAAAVAGGAGFTLTVNGRGFISTSVVRWNGWPRSTAFVSSTQLRAAIDAADISALGTAQVSVFTAAPGGGTSAALPFTIAPPPSLTVSSTTAVAGQSVTVTLLNGLGGSTDWLAFAASSAANTSYLQSTYVGSGVSTRTWTVTMPATAGTYEFRLFLNNSYTRAATSPAITVLPGPPVLTTLSPAGAAAGSAAFSLTVAGSGFVANSFVSWNGSPRSTTYVSSTQLQAAIAAADVAAPGTAKVTVTTPPAGGSGGTSAALPFTIGTPTLSVSATSVQAGASVTVTLGNGFGGSTDWLAFALSSSSNSSYVQYTYVGAGVTTRAWTVTAPATPGTYEFRLFTNNSYTRVATSAPITVSGGPTPVLSVSATSVRAGASVTMTLTNGYGGSMDWLALAATTAPTTSYLAYTYVGAGVTTRTWTVTMPSTPGTYEFRLFPNNGYTLAAKSPPVTVTQ
jgi:subtilisin